MSLAAHLSTLIAIASGSALGGVCRYLTMVGTANITGKDFPFGTLCVNVIGSFIMGALISAIALKWNIPDTAKYFIIVGFLGSYTTFSTFSLDTITLFERGAVLSAISYVLASFTLSIGGFLLGASLTRMTLN